jgi:hypothetical protein
MNNRTREIFHDPRRSRPTNPAFEFFAGFVTNVLLARN